MLIQRLLLDQVVESEEEHLHTAPLDQPQGPRHQELLPKPAVTREATTLALPEEVAEQLSSWVVVQASEWGIVLSATEAMVSVWRSLRL